MKFLALDFETGGLDPQRHGAVSLGVAIFDTDVDPDVPTHTMEWIIAPPTDKNGKIRCEYDINALAINGLKWPDILKGHRESTVLNELQVLAVETGMRRAMIVSHNTVFDAAFLSQMVYRCGTWNYGKFQAQPDPLLGPWACTRRMAEVLGLPDKKLDTVCAHFGLARTGEYHGALEDAILCGQVYRRLCT